MVTTTTLVPYREPDAGRGLRLQGPWLVSAPSATHVRWLAPWCQAVLALAWNAVVVALRWLRPRDVSPRVLAAYGGLVALVVIGLAVWLPISGRAS